MFAPRTVYNVLYIFCVLAGLLIMAYSTHSAYKIASLGNLKGLLVLAKCVAKILLRKVKE